MPFIKDNLPGVEAFFDSRGLTLKGPSRSKWRTASCEFHGSSDSLRVNTHTGAWVDDPNKLFTRTRPTPFPAKDALQILSMESLLIAVIGADLAKGKPLSEADRERLNKAVGRVQAISGAFA